jgi:Protein of unknown function (DUF3616)
MISRQVWSPTRRAFFASVALLGSALAACSIPHTAAPPRIAGGRFEASGVVEVPASNGVLFVDDKSTKHIFWMELTADGRQASPAVKVPLGATVVDPEDITTDGTHFYLVGSQSAGTEGNGILRFRFDPSQRRVAELASIAGLKAFLATRVEELKDVDPRRGSKEELNIEGLAWDPVRSRLLLGLRAPVIDGHALVIPLKMRDPRGAFRADNLEVDGGKAIRLALGGAGIRSLEYDEASRVFWVIAGAASSRETEEFRLIEWRDGSGGPAFTELARYSSSLKPEGITRATAGGASHRFLVFDTGRYATIQ